MAVLEIVQRLDSVDKIFEYLFFVTSYHSVWCCANGLIKGFSLIEIGMPSYMDQSCRTCMFSFSFFL